MSKRCVTHFILVAAACLFFSVSGASADELQSVNNSSAQEVAGGMAVKLGRGVTNFATGWLELPKQIYYTSKEDGVAMGVLVGPLKGIIMTVARTVSGAGEAVTFYVPYPGFFEPYFDPAFVWQKE